MKHLRKLSILLAVVMIVCGFTACTGVSVDKEMDGFDKISMITDSGGIHDASFNQSAWEGVLSFQKEHPEIKCVYVESAQESDYDSNLNSLIDLSNFGDDLIIAVGYALSDHIANVARLNPNNDFALCDATVNDIPDNLLTVTYRSEEVAFLVGYIAANTTKTGKIGFIGGMDTSGTHQYEYGYRAGAMYGAKEKNLDLDIQVKYVDNFSDQAKGKAIAGKMYCDGCDVLFQSSGAAGLGVIEAAKEADKYIIGVDMDQSILAPNNVLTSAIKSVDKSTKYIAEQKYNGNFVGGYNISLGLKEDGVGLPEQNKNLSEEVYNNAMVLRGKIISEGLVIPYNQQTFDEFKANGYSF